MTLGSASADAPTRPRTASVSHTAKVEAWDHNEEHSRLAVCPNAPVPRAEAEVAASPSSTAVIDVLHLSDIDWDALSFTSSPSPHTATNHTTGPKRSKTVDGDVKEAETSSCTAELCYINCSLRDRVLLKNGHKATNQAKENDDGDSKQQKYELPSLERLPAHDSHLKPHGQIPRKDHHDSKSTGKKSNVRKKEADAYKRHRVANNTIVKTKTSMSAPQKQRTSVAAAVSSFAAPPERCSSDPGQCAQAQNEKSTKKSVCASACSSSDDSDTESRRLGPRGKADANPSETNRPKSRKLCADVEISGTSVSSQSRRPGASAATVIELDSEDSVVCSDCESPLPLAERLRLKFQK